MKLLLQILLLGSLVTNTNAADAMMMASSGTSQSGGYTPKPIESFSKKAATLNDYGKAAMPAVRVVEATVAVGSLVPVGEAGAAIGIGEAVLTRGLFTEGGVTVLGKYPDYINLFAVFAVVGVSVAHQQRIVKQISK
jgi:hypothetical protein